MFAHVSLQMPQTLITLPTKPLEDKDQISFYKSREVHIYL